LVTGKVESRWVYDADILAVAGNPLTEPESLIESVPFYCRGQRGTARQRDTPFERTLSGGATTRAGADHDW
jgi:hypothetical protein